MSEKNKVLNYHLWILLMLFNKSMGKIKNTKSLLAFSLFKKQLEPYTSALLDTYKELQSKLPAAPTADDDEESKQAYEQAVQQVNAEWVNLLNEETELPNSIKPISVGVFSQFELTDEEALVLVDCPLIDVSTLLSEYFVNEE